MIKYKITFLVEGVRKPIIIESVGYNTRHAIGKAYPIIKKQYGYSDRKLEVVKIKSLGEVKDIKVKSHNRFYISDEEMEEIREERRKMKIK